MRERAVIVGAALALFATIATGESEAGKPPPPPPPAPALYAVVAKSGADYTSPRDAVDDLSRWCGVPAADRRCLLKIRPGIYDLGTTALIIPSWVDVEGSGDASVLTSQVTFADSLWSGISTDSGTVVLKAGSALRSIAVENTSPGSGIAVLVRQTELTPAGEVLIENVTARAYPGSGSIPGDHGAIMAQGPGVDGVLAVTVREADASASIGPGIGGDIAGITFFAGVTGRILDSRASASGGGWTSGATIHGSAAGGEIRDSVIEAREMVSGNAVELVDAFVTNTRVTSSGPCTYGCTAVDAFNVTVQGGEIAGFEIQGGRYTGTILDVVAVGADALLHCVDARGGGFAPVVDQPIYP